MKIYLRNDATRPACIAFSKMGLRVAPDLIEMLGHGSSDVRWSVVQVLGNFASEFGDERCIAALEQCRNDVEPRVRESANLWLADIHQAEAQPA